MSCRYQCKSSFKIQDNIHSKARELFQNLLKCHHLFYVELSDIVAIKILISWAPVTYIGSEIS